MIHNSVSKRAECLFELVHLILQKLTHLAVCCNCKGVATSSHLHICMQVQAVPYYLSAGTTHSSAEPYKRSSSELSASQPCAEQCLHDLGKG